MTQVNFEFVHPSGAPREDVEFTIMLKRPGFVETEDGVVLPEIFSAITDAEGKFTLELAPSSTPYYIIMVDPTADPDEPCRGRVSYTFYVPDIDTPVRAQDLFIATPPSNQPWDEAALVELTQAVTDAQAAATAAEAAAVEAQEVLDQLGDLAELGDQVTANTAQISALEIAQGNLTVLVDGQADDIAGLSQTTSGHTTSITGLESSREYILTPGSGVTIDRTDPDAPVISAFGSTWGGITGDIAAQVDLQEALDDKVDAVPGKQLTDVNFTQADKDKLDAAPTDHNKGYFPDFTALQTAWPTAAEGDYAFVDPGEDLDVLMYIWDSTDSAWVSTGGDGGTMTPAEVKSAYESNDNTNAFTDAEKTKLASVASGAQVNYAPANQAEAEAGTGTSLLSWTAQRVRQAIVAWWTGSAEKTKLDGIAAGATANSSDAVLLARANHTGTQAISTVTNLQTSLDTLTTNVDNKVDKDGTKVLSTNDFTTAYKTKLDGLQSSHFKGSFTSFANMVAGVPAPVAGDYADVDAGAGTDVARYVWDVNDTKWVAGSGGGGPANTDSLPEGITNLYHTTARVRATPLTGISFLDSTIVAATDTVLQAIGKLAAKLNGLGAVAFSNSYADLSNKPGVATTGAIGFMPQMPASDDKQYAFKNGALVEIPAAGSIAVADIASAAGVLNLSAVTASVIQVSLTENITSVVLPAGVVGQYKQLLIEFTNTDGFTVSGWQGGAALNIPAGGIPAVAKGAGKVTQYVLTAIDSTAWNLQVDLNPASPQMRIPSGQRLIAGIANCTALGSTAMVAARIQFVPFTVTRSMKLSAMGICVGTLLAGTATVGIYDSDGNATYDQPGTKLASCADGALSTSTTGTKLGTVDIDLEAGHLYFAAYVSTAATVVRSIAVAGVAPSMGATDNGTNFPTMFIATTTTNVLPANTAALTLATATSVPPAIYLVEAIA